MKLLIGRGQTARGRQALTEDGSAGQRRVSIITGKEQRKAEKPGNFWNGGSGQASRGRHGPRGGRP